MKFCYFLLTLSGLALAAPANGLADEQGEQFRREDPGRAALIKAENTAAFHNPRSAAGESPGPVVTLTEENDDLANNGDQHYTQGIRLSYSLGENRTPHWAAHLGEKLPDLGMKLEAVRCGLV